MAYRFKLKEGLRHGVRRIAVEQLERAIEAPHAGSDRAVWVHETRKALKRTRALLKCVRSGLGERTYRAENTALARIARSLSGLRDRDVMVVTMEALSGQDEALDHALAWLERAIAEEAEAGPSKLRSAKSADLAVSRSIKALEKARARLSKIAVEGELVDVVGAGVRAAQRSGQEALARLTLNKTDENLHELRKAVQNYQRQQTLISPIWPEMQAIRIGSARELAQILGEAQDLAVLGAAARKMASQRASQDVDHCERVVLACQVRHDELREKSMPLAARLLAARPKAAEQELIAGWRAAAELARSRDADIEPKATVQRSRRGRRPATV